MIMKGNKNSALDKIRKKRESYNDKIPTPPDDDNEIQKSLEELQRLTIKDDDLRKIRDVQSTEPRTLIHKKITFKINKPVAPPDKKQKTAVVAKPALPDAIHKSPDIFHACLGPKFDCIGRLVSHSIAGNYDDFYSMASKAGQVEGLPLPQDGYVPLKKPLSLHESPPPITPETQSEHVSCAETKALRNWKVRMAQRSMQQNYICKLLERQPQDLVMNHADYIRNRVELCEVLDRVLPQITYGKGYRKNCEFWRQQERFGDEMKGIFATLNLTEKGMPPSIDHVGVPPLVRQEKGMVWHPANTPRIQHPWDQNSYLLSRKMQLRDLIEEEDSQHPDFEGLEVVGSKIKEESTITRNKLLVHGDSNGCEIPDNEQTLSYSPVENSSSHSSDSLSTKEPTNGVKFFPALIFDGEQLQWAGNRHNISQQLMPFERCVIFETLLYRQVESYLDIANNGTTAIFYCWKKLPKDNPFNIFHQPVQRFYFNDSDGVILPGMTLQFPFTFKSSHCGIYSEQWLFETHPVLQGGAPIILTLRGTIIPEDKFCEERKELREHLKQLQQEHLAERMVHDLCSSICSEEPSPSPIDAYITQEVQFRRQNPHLHYDHKAVKEIQNIYSVIFQDAEKEGYMWNFSIADLAQIISELDDSEEKEGYLNRLEENICRMQFQSDTFKSYDLYQCGFLLLGDALDLLTVRLGKIWNGLNVENNTEKFQAKKHRSKSAVNTQDGSRTKPHPRPSHSPSIAVLSMKTSSSRHNSGPDNISLSSEKIYIEIYDTLCQTIDRMERIFSSVQRNQLLNSGYDELIERNNDSYCRV